MIEVDIIIPTYRPSDIFLKQIRRLNRQTILPHKVYIINTDRKIWDSLEMDRRLVETDISGFCEVHHIEKKDFDHAATRDMAVKLSGAKYFICMTQDALPRDEHLIENLIKPMLDDEHIKMTYARQLYYSDASILEKLTRRFNYPKESRTKTKADIDRLGIKTYFVSNVCAAYDRETYDSLGGFAAPAIFNEDMIYAAGLIKSGSSIRYCADALVYHSHRLSGVDQLRRYFDNGVSQAQHPEIFEGVAIDGEGARLVGDTARSLARMGYILYLPQLIYISGMKYIGFKLGRQYRKLSEKSIERLTLNKEYWKKWDR